MVKFYSIFVIFALLFITINCQQPVNEESSFDKFRSCIGHYISKIPSIAQCFQSEKISAPNDLLTCINNKLINQSDKDGVNRCVPKSWQTASLFGNLFNALRSN